MELPINQILNGHCIEVMQRFPDEIIDMVMFSPPYWGLRDYGEQTQTVWGGEKDCEHEWVDKTKVKSDAAIKRVPNSILGPIVDRDREPQVLSSAFCRKCGAWRGQLGLEPSWQMYVEHMALVCGELKRVLKKTGSMYIVLGDTYAGSGQGQKISEQRDTYKKYSPKLNFPKERPTLKQAGYKAKCLMGIPWRVSFALIEDGWTLRNDIIWHKPNHMPSSVKDRLTKSYEHIFHFVKSKKYYYDLDAIREPHKVAVERWKIPNAKKKSSKYAGKLAGQGMASKTTTMFNPKGKNPGDVVSGRVKANVKHFVAKGSGGHFAYDGLDSKDGKHQHPKGKNPSDVIKHDVAVGRVGNVSYTDPLHTKAYSNKGKNPSDIIKIGMHHGSSLTKGRATHYEGQLIEGNPLGKNPSDFWSVNTKPFKGAHFAVYPEDICLRPIKSSCPEFVCKKCGKTRTRITKLESYPTRKLKNHTYKSRNPERNISISETVGWSDCGCNAGFEPGIVLDIMCGSGTTCVVAKKLGRNYIGIELNPEYIEIAKKRLSKIPEKLSSFFKGAVK